jgi:hypothetical protein
VIALFFAPSSISTHACSARVLVSATTTLVSRSIYKA